ncbi:MAG: TonB-dependent receptor [Pyrinomonadaceae bacterium]
MRRAMFSFFKSFCMIAVVATFATIANAQFGSGISGVVVDGTGSVVPGATVTLTNPATNAVLEAQTNDTGLYRFNNLPPGNYRITVSKSGFKKKLVENASLAAESSARYDIALEPGDVSAEVTIDGSSAVALETETPNLARNITNKEILELPQVGRDPYNLVRLAPGVFGDGARSAGGQSNRIGNNGTGPGGSNNGIFAVENQVQVSANGQRVTSNNFEIDGVSVNSQTWGGAAVITPTQESISEVQVTSSTYSAEDGRNSGAQVKVITKYGTNAYSGSAFYKINNPGLNAYNKFNGIPGLVTGTPTRVNDRFKTYGGSFGGKIIKDKLFFFLAYEGTKNASNTLSGPTFAETASFRQQLATLRGGTLSAAFLRSGAEPRIATVLTTTPAGSTNLCSLLGSPYNANGGVNTNCQMVGSGIDIGSITGAYGTYVPDATNSIGGGLDGIADLQYVTISNQTKFRGGQYTGRIDYNLTDKDKLAFTSNFTPLSAFSTNLAAQSRPQADLNSDRLTYLLGAIYTRTISSTMINEARFNFTRWKFDEIAANPNTDFGLPRVEIEAIWSDRLRFGANRAETTPGLFDQRQMDIRDILTKIAGNHTFKAGVEYRREVNRSSSAGGARPLYSFTKMWNFANGTPVFESINADATGTPNANDVPFNAANIGAFLQDDWKLRQNLTLNLGLRWEYFQPIKPGNGKKLGRLKLGANGLSDATIEQVTTFTNPDYNNFAPQLGFAWSPKTFGDKLVVRGGGGLGYDRLASALFSNARFVPPNAARYSICCGSSANGGNTGATTGTIQFVGSSTGILGYPRNPTIGGGFAANGGPNLGQVEVYSTYPNLPTAWVARYSLEAQYELPWKFVATAAYQGSKGSRFVRILPLHLITTGVSTSPTFRAVYFASPDVNTSYNALVTGLRRRFSDSFNVNVNYRFAKSLDTVSVEAPCGCTNQTYAYDNSTEKGPSDFDVTHYFNASGTWEPSWFKGRKDVFGDLLYGWSFSPIVTWRGGFPWTPVTGGAIQLSSTSSNINTIRPRQYYGTAPLDNSNATYLAGGQFPNNFIRDASNNVVACNNLTTTPAGCSRYFLTPLNGISYLTNVPGVGRNVFRGPRYFNVDLSIAKQFDISSLATATRILGEKAKLDLRFNFFNLLNNLNFAPFNAFSNSTRADNIAFGVPTAALAGRVGEFQARFSF